MVQSGLRTPAVLPNWLARGLIVVLLLALYGQLLFSAKNKSPTIDEPNHLTRGYVYLKTGDLRFSRDDGHPPLYNLLCAWSASLLGDVPLPLHSPSWVNGFRNAFVTEFLFSGAVPLGRVFFVGRFPVMLTTLCLAVLAGRWAGELYGPRGRLTAVLLCALDPNLIAHGQLVTTDMGITLLMFVSVYQFWRFLQGPSLRRLLLSGLFLGLAQGCKFSAALLLPVWGLLGLVEATRPNGGMQRVWGLVHRKPSPAERDQESGLWRGCGPIKLQGLAGRVLALGVSMALAIGIAALVVWAIYGFRVGRVAGWPTPVPAPDFVDGFLGQLGHASATGHPAFLMGQYSDKGWWYYFPVAFVLKTPLPALIALACVLVSNAWKRFQHAEWPLLLVPALYLGVSLWSVLNIGYRHLLPMLPFLWVYVGRGGSLLAELAARNRRRWLAAGAVAMGLWLTVGTLRVAPDYLAYFNELAGGPDGGWRYLVDSNLDWGQDLPGLKAYLDRQQAPRVYLSWFGSTYPYLYGLGLEYRLLPSHFSFPYSSDAAQSPYNPLYPEPALYAISATNLQGVGLAAGDVFARFRDLQPVARIGHSIMVYDLTSAPAGHEPTCISGLRLKDLTPETTALSLGRAPGPVKWFEHGNSFVLPATGDPVYVLPALPLPFAPAWQTDLLARAAVIHQQAGEGHTPTAMVYRLDRSAADQWLAAALASITTVPSVRLDYGLEFLGYQLLSGNRLQPGQALELITVWRPTGEMPAAATDLKVFVHLLDASNQWRAGEDRLGLHAPTWEGGDWLFQYHRLPIPSDAAPGTYQLEVGMYSPITTRRLTVWGPEGVPSDRLMLEPVVVSAL